MALLYLTEIIQNGTLKYTKKLGTIFIWKIPMATLEKSVLYR